MSESDHSVPGRECGADVAAYALGSLDAVEAEDFRRHVETCSVCRDELAAFQEVINALPMSAPAHRAPAGVRRRVLHAIAEEPRPPGDAARGAASPRRGFPWRLPVPALAIGAVLALAVVVVIGISLGSSAGGTRVIRAQVTGQGSAQLKVAGGHGELVVRDFSPPPAGQIYEVWVQRGKNSPSPTSALFSVTAGGDADVDVPADLHGVDLVMVTPEPAGGTKVPTHPPVISAALT
ncbi:MAG TPA: anti-sigma factor [Solirubrobacteraceae bacterium]|jgi:anti-sigma-K factor RskA|nr:anti-sigma factor [Solirubrobacteraceae bacterium]